MLNNRNSTIKAMRPKRGQSTVEYIILVSAVIGVVILFIAAPKSIFKNKVNEVYNTVYSDLQDRADVLAESHNTPQGPSGGTPTDYNVNILKNIL